MCGKLFSSFNLVKAHMSWIMTRPRSPSGSVPKPAQGHSAWIEMLNNIISKRGSQAEGNGHPLSHVLPDDLILHKFQETPEYLAGRSWSRHMWDIVWCLAHYKAMEEEAL